jgi:hypothetical protein
MCPLHWGVNVSRANSLFFLFPGPTEIGYSRLRFFAATEDYELMSTPGTEIIETMTIKQLAQRVRNLNVRM